MTRALVGIVAVALAHATLYIVHQRPDWDVAWTDQAGYRRLGAALAETGSFTRYPDAPAYVPEAIRTPGYPLFVAAIYRVFGPGNDLAVVSVQALVFAAICLLVYAAARRVDSDRTALGAAALAALYPPLPYAGGLLLTELWAAFVATGAMVVLLRALQQRRMRDFALAGALLGATTLVRPVFVLLPPFLAVAMPLLVPGERRRAAACGWAVLVAAAGLVLAPWFAYNAVHFGRLTISPAGGVGRALWEGTWQGRWPGRVHAALTELAAAPVAGDALDARVRALADATGHAPEPMLRYVAEWRAIRAVWDAPQDPMARVHARVAADALYLEAALAHIRADPFGHLRRRLTYGPFVLWAGEIPIRYTLIDEVPVLAIRAIWLAQAALVALAGVGLLRLARGGRWPEAALLALPLVYVTAVHLPLLCESRQSLPVKPVLLLLAAIGSASCISRLRRARPA